MTCQTGLLLPEHGYLPALDARQCHLTNHKSLKQGLGNQEKWENEWEMPFHPDNCVTHSFRNKIWTHTYTLHWYNDTSWRQSTLPSTWVSLCRKTQNGTNMCSKLCKGRKTLGFLQRNLKNGITNNEISQIKALAYLTLVHPIPIIVQELCESRGGRPGLSVLTSLMVSVDVKQYWTMLRHWSQLVPNMSTDIWGH